MQNKRKYKLSDKAVAAIKSDESLYEELRQVRGVQHSTFIRQLYSDRFPWWLSESPAIDILRDRTGLSVKQILKEVS